MSLVLLSSASYFMHLMHVFPALHDACFSCTPFCKAQFHSIYAYPKSILKLRWFEQNVTCKFPICDWLDKNHIHVFYFLFPQQLNLDRLLAKMWEAMGLVRVYTKPQGQQPDFTDPVVLSTVCDKLIMFFFYSSHV